MAGAMTQERVRAGAPGAVAAPPCSGGQRPSCSFAIPRSWPRWRSGRSCSRSPPRPTPCSWPPPPASSSAARSDRPSITRYGAGTDLHVRANRPARTGPARATGSTAPTRRRRPPTAFRELAAGSPILGHPVEAILGDRLDVSFGAPREPQDGRLFSVDGGPRPGRAPGRHRRRRRLDPRPHRRTARRRARRHDPAPRSRGRRHRLGRRRRDLSSDLLHAPRWATGSPGRTQFRLPVSGLRTAAAADPGRPRPAAGAGA